jgi:hypothetical protein
MDEMVATDDGRRLWTTRTGAGVPPVLRRGGPGFWEAVAVFLTESFS